MAQRPAGQQVPTGTITLVLGDIEGSTRLWETRPDDMTAAMARFTEVLSSSVPRHRGVLPIEQGEGDSFVAAFTLATDAVACALELQLEWGRASWPFRVRIALHSGEAQTRDGERYEGPTIIRCARLRSIAHGGQTLLSQATCDLVVDSLPVGAWLDDGPQSFLPRNRKINSRPWVDSARQWTDWRVVLRTVWRRSRSRQK